MSEVEIPTPQRPADAVEERNEALAAQLGISILDYSQLVEDAALHATQHRLWAIPIHDHQTWVPVGPRNVAGRVTALAQDPTNRLVLYAGTAHGGLWQTCDAGDTWEHLGEEELNAPVSAIAIHAHDRSTLLIGTGLPVPYDASGRGLYRVTVPPPSRQGLPRNPAQFTRLAPAPPPSLSPADVARTESLHGASMRYTRIRFDPYEKERFWAASQTGLWRWEPRPSSGAARFVLEFPPESIASGDSIPPLPSAVVAGDSYAPYATDVLVARDPRSEDRFPPGSRIPRHLVIYVAVHGEGVYRGRFDRSDRVMRWERRLGVPGFLQSFGRIQLALCERRPQRVYALMDDGKDLPTAVYRSDDNGEHWRTTGHPFSAGDNQAFYDLVLEVSPSNPDMIYAGVVDGYLSRDGGGTWKKILDWEHYDRDGDYAQHADQHAAVFDRFERGKLWIGNDGGIACSRDLLSPLTPHHSWRARSHGIAAGQFQDISFDPASAYRRCVGGLQDNGSWLSIGGPTWYRVGWADGAFSAFDPADKRQFIISSQYAHTRYTIKAADAGEPEIVNPVLHDIPDSIAKRHTMTISVDQLETFETFGEESAPFIPVIAQNPAAPRELIFGWKRSSGGAAAYFSKDFGTTIEPLKGLTKEITPKETETSAACFGPPFGNPAKFDGWVGFTNGKLLHTEDAPGGNWVEPANLWPAGVDGQPISRIAVHPADHRIVAVSTSGTPGRVFITYDRGATWQNISERVPTSVEITPATPSVAIGQRRQLTAIARFTEGDPVDVTTSVNWKSADPAKADFSKAAGELGQLIPKATGTTDVTATLIVFGNKREGKTTVTIAAGSGIAPALPFAPRAFDLRALPPAPIGALAFDPADPKRLFAGTLAGVYLLPNLPGTEAAGGKPPIAIRWQPFHHGLPLTMINDLARVPGTNMLRAATFGRGLWDCDLSGTTRPRHRLVIRQTVIEDGFSDTRPAPAAPGDDPRLPAGEVALDHAHAFDIRVDSKPHEFFDDRVDGVEFDERLGADKLAPLAANAVYVQIHNVGRESVPNVTVHLYFRESPIPAPIRSAAVQLPADATLGSIDEIYHLPAFEPLGGGSPADGARWTRAGAPRKVEIVAPGTPVVVRFDWKPPAALASKNVALLALCSGPDDAHDALPAAAASAPRLDIASFIANERRAAIRIVEVDALPPPDIFIPNGVDDDGSNGSIAAALRSPHIIVTQQASDAATAFRNPLDLRKHDRLKGGTLNHIFVRVHNRGASDLSAEVEVWAVKVKADLTPDFAPANWLRLSPAPPAKLEIAVAAGAWAFAEVTWTPPDPVPPDPAPPDPAPPAGELKSYILVALAKTSDDKDPLPDKSGIDSLEKFRAFLARESASDNVAARAIRWVAP